MSDLKLGEILTGDERRDAIHIAVAPVVAAQILAPGQHVGFVDGWEVGPSANNVGIVDPFIKGYVAKGERCYLFLYPNTVTSLRHEWTHPAFTSLPAAVAVESNDPKSASERWLRAFADEMDLTYNALLAAGDIWVEQQEYTTQYGQEHWRNTFYEKGQDFWKHYEVVRGVTVQDQSAPFSCSC